LNDVGGGLLTTSELITLFWVVFYFFGIMRKEKIHSYEIELIGFFKSGSETIEGNFS